MGNETGAAKILQEGPQLARHPLDVVLLGDSITQGLGSKKMNFTQDLQDGLGDFYRVENLAMTGTTIDYAVELVQKGGIDACGGICVVLYGNVDAQNTPELKGQGIQAHPHALPEKRDAHAAAFLFEKRVEACRTAF